MKRAIDVSVSLGVLVVGAPLLAAVGAGVAYFHGWPILFQQRRPGRGGEVFSIFKFRTMTNERSPDGSLLPDDRRMTKFGQWLRSTSLDELPEFLNVLRGEMSLVGPRPLLVQYLERYTPEQARRHDVRPGITGWAAVQGRNAVAWPERLAMDVWYVDHWSNALDLKILAQTLHVALAREGISAEGHVTMPEFQGEA